MRILTILVEEFEMKSIFVLFALCAAAASSSADLLVDLSAANLAEGVLTTWNNYGTLGGSFSSTNKYGVTTTPTVETIDGRKAVTFSGPSGTATDVMQSSFTAPASITGNSPFTAAFWMYNPSVQAHEHALSWSERQTATAEQTYQAIGFGSNPTPNEGDALYRRGADVGYAVPPSAGQWHHVAVTFAGGKPGDVKTYIDGVLDNTVTLNENMNTMAGQPVLIGGMYWTGHYVPDYPFDAFSGSLASVQLYDEELDANQIAALAADSGSGNLPATVDAGLDGFTWLDEGIASTWLDGSITDDGFGPISSTWSVSLEPSTGAALITSPAAEDTTVTMTVAGEYEFRLEVIDSEYILTDSVLMTVYADGCAAARALPSYVKFKGDLDDDCDVDFDDFVAFAREWMKQAE